MNKFIFPKKLLSRLGLLSLVITLALLLADQAETAIAWWIMMACMLPALIWVSSSRFLSFKVFVWSAFVTQAVTMPYFYLFPDKYQFQIHRPFYYTGLESLQIFYKVGIFLLVFLFIAGILTRILKKSIQDHHLIRLVANIHQVPTSDNLFATEKISLTTSLISTGLIILIVLLMIPLNNWMFHMGIGLTGVLPPELPYRLSGILTYLAKLVIPALLVFLYLRTRRRSFLLVVVLGLYSAFLGVSTVSRSAALMVVLAPLAFSLLDRRWPLFIVAGVLATVSLSLTTYSRNIVYLVLFGSSGSVTGLDVIGVLLKTARDIIDWDQLWLIIPSIIGRFESFEQLWRVSFVNPEILGGGWAIITKSVDWRLIDLGHDAIHLEVLGYTVPEGFYMGLGGVLEYMLAAVNQSIFFYIPFAIVAASLLILQETALRVIGNRYYINPMLLSLLIFFLSLNYFVAPGYDIMNFFFIVLCISSLFPRFAVIQTFLVLVGACSQQLRVTGRSLP